jgi:hypothetical protein
VLIRVQWERQSLETTNDAFYGSYKFDFPDDDLLPQLIDKYYEEIDIVFPLLHRPTFERSVRERLHLRNEGFASILLLVCATGSLFVDDPRVVIDGNPGSGGWKYFNQVQMIRKSLLAPPSLYDLQICCVSVLTQLSIERYSNHIRSLRLCSCIILQLLSRIGL